MSDTAKIIAGMNEKEKKIMREKFYNETSPAFTGIPITLFFPDNSNLKTIELTGIPPQKDQIFWFRNYAVFNKPVPEGRNFEGNNAHHCWKVKEVNYSVTVPSTEKEELLFDGHYRCEVQLVKYYPVYSIKYSILGKIGYYTLKRFLSKVKRFIRWYFTEAKLYKPGPM